MALMKQFEGTAERAERRPASGRPALAFPTLARALASG